MENTNISAAEIMLRSLCKKKRVGLYISMRDKKRGNAWINLMASDLTLATFRDFESAIAWLGGGHD